METLLQDLRYGIRMLLKSRGFTAVAVLSLALGIGGNTVIFSIIDAVLLRPLPFRDSSQLVMVFERNSARNRGNTVVAPANFLRWRQQNHVFTEMAAGIDWPANLNDASGEPERAVVGVVSPNLFSLLGVQPLLGRSFTNDEELPEKGNVVLLSRAYWQRRYGGDPNVLGRTIELSAQPVTIVGVMPDRVNFPAAVDMWVPFVLTPQRRSWDGRYLTVVARLKPGITVAQARVDMDVVAASTRAELPQFDTGWDANVVPLGEQVVSNVRRGLLVLLGAVVFVLLIACANIANMLLARASVRSREMAVRVALGASRSRIIRQVLTESSLLGLLGGISGLLLASWSLNPLIAALPAEIPAFRRISINPQVLGFAFAVSIATGLMAGLASALRVSATTPHDAMLEGGRGSSAGRSQQRARNALVVAEVATAMVLLTTAGLMIESFVRLLRVDPGFDPEHVLTMQVSLPGSTYAKPELQAAYYKEAIERIRTLPGVLVAGAISGLPLEGGGVTTFTADDRPAPKVGEEPSGVVRIATEDYFRALRIPLLLGRWFDPNNDRAEDSIKKLVINQGMAQTLWPGNDPIGKRITLEWRGLMDRTGVVHAEIIGVVGNVALNSLNNPGRRSTLYFYMPQVPNLFMTFVVRTSGNPGLLAVSVQQQIAAIDRKQPVTNIRTLSEIVGASRQQPRFTTALLGAFAALALLLAAIGIYGVISYSVSQRRVEFGVRMALGAQQNNILGLVLKQGMRMVLAGVIAGIILALLLTRLVAALLFNVRPGDPLTLLVASMVVMLTALAANLVPARRAASIEPTEALRCE